LEVEVLTWRFFVLRPDGAAGPFRDPPPVGRVISRKVEPDFYARGVRETRDPRSDKEVADSYWSALAALADQQTAGIRFTGTEMQRLKDLEDEMVERAMLDPAPEE